MDQIIIEHYKNFHNFLSLNFLKIPFLVKNGLYVNDRQVFKYKLRDKYEFLIEEILINKKKEGIWIYYDESGNKMVEGNYKNNKQEGLWIYYYNNGNKMSEENWKYGKIEGFWISWYDNGQIDSEENYKNGKQNGLLIQWHRNEKPMQQATKKLEVNLKNGKREGLCISWYEDGQKKPEENYKDGILI